MSFTYKEEVAIVEGLVMADYLKVAAISIFLYDYIHTMQEEVETIWPSRRSLGKYLYFISRYSPFIDSAFASIFITFARGVTPQSCMVVGNIMNVVGVLGIAASEAILAVSLYAMLGAKRKYGIMLALILGGFTLAGLAIVINIILGTETMRSPLPYRDGCWFALSGPSYAGWITVGYCILFAGELVLTILAVTLGLRKYMRSRSPLMGILYRDGIYYYLALLAWTTANIIINMTVPLYRGVNLSNLQRVFHPILAIRLLLHIRKPVDPEPSLNLSGLEFKQKTAHSRDDSMLDYDDDSSRPSPQSTLAPRSAPSTGLASESNMT